MRRIASHFYSHGAPRLLTDLLRVIISSCLLAVAIGTVVTDLAVSSGVAQTPTWTLTRSTTIEQGLLAVTVGSANLPIIVDGVSYAGAELPKVFMWKIGSIHILQVNATIQGGPGVRHVFVQWSDGSKETSRTVTVSQPITYTVTSKTQYELKVISDFGNPTGGGWYDAGCSAPISVITPVEETTSVRHRFNRWEGGPLTREATDASNSVLMDGPKTIKATWITQYYLKVSSSYGAVAGEGWYDEGSLATFSVTPSQQPEERFLGSLGGKRIFQAWSGDSTASSANATVKMDGPKTVRARWITDYSQPYLILGGITAAIVVAAALIFMRVRRKAERLRAEIEELEKKLAASKSEGDSLRTEVAQLQDRLVESMPRAESEAKVNEVETKLSGARRDLEVARTTIQDLDDQLSQSAAKIAEFQGKLAQSVPKAEAEAESRELTDRIRELESKLSESVPRTEFDAAKADAQSTIRGLQVSLSESKSEAEALKGKLAMTKDVAKKLLSRVPQQQGFSFHLDMDTPTGKYADSLQDFCQRLLEVEPRSVSFHLEHGDFQNWLSQAIGDEELASKLSSLRGLGLPAEELKSKVYDEVKARCDELSTKLTKD
jgi:hypothetical protein